MVGRRSRSTQPTDSSRQGRKSNERQDASKVNPKYLRSTSVDSKLSDESVGGQDTTKDVETVPTMANYKDLPAVDFNYPSYDSVGSMPFLHTKSRTGMRSAERLQSKSDDLGPTDSYQLKLLKDKYMKLKRDYNLKMEEVSTARVQLESINKEASERRKRRDIAEQKSVDLMTRIKEAELEKAACYTSRDRIVDIQTQIMISVQKAEHVKEELEECKNVLMDQCHAVENTRMMYMEAEQLAEEQSRKLSGLRKENERLGEEVAVCVDSAEEEFHNQICAFGPISEAISRLNQAILSNEHKTEKADDLAVKIKMEMLNLLETNEMLKREIQETKMKHAKLDEETATLRGYVEEQLREQAEIKAENFALRAKMKDLESTNADKDLKIHFKDQEVEELADRLETLREECARQISSSKYVLTNIRKSQLKQLAALERDLAKTKANESAAERERDEIRQKLEQQIHSLGDNFFQAKETAKILHDDVGCFNNDRQNNEIDVCSSTSDQ